MASDDKKIKTNPAKKSKVPPNEKSVSGVDAKTESPSLNFSKDYRAFAT